MDSLGSLGLLKIKQRPDSFRNSSLLDFAMLPLRCPAQFFHRVYLKQLLSTESPKQGIRGKTPVVRPSLPSRLLRLGHNLILDPFIRGSRQDQLLEQFILEIVRTPVDNLV
jgi:hypothetical protein